jgi:hypothetical protein
MRGVSYLLDNDNKKIAVQIDLKTIEQHQKDIEDLLDGIIAEARKGEEKVPFDKVLKNLKKAGKLK